MIKAITSLSELNIAIRTQLVSQSEVPANHVLNGQALRGATLYESKENDTFKSFSLDDIVIVFDIDEAESDDDMIETSGESILQFASFSCHLTIYGNESMVVAKKLKSRLLSEKVLLALEKTGVHIQDISAIESGNEHINNTLWHRKDFNINFSCRLNFSHVVDMNDYEHTNVTILKTKDVD